MLLFDFGTRRRGCYLHLGLVVLVPALESNTPFKQSSKLDLFLSIYWSCIAYDKGDDSKLAGDRRAARTLNNFAAMIAQLEDELESCQEEAGLREHQLEATRELVTVLQKYVDICQHKIDTQSVICAWSFQFLWSSVVEIL